ncbi:uncharacterized protein LY89DRAFT_726142, partial [Mollisia scopiformis]
MLAAPIVWSRAHKKSRNGCNTCKARKVKCDEHRPVCDNCSRRCADLIACDFPHPTDLSKTRKLVPRDTSSDTSSNDSYRPPPIHVVDTHPIGKSTSSKQRRLEMRLLHHYTTTTCHGLPSFGKHDPHRIFSTVVPQIGFVSDLVLDAMLAFSAFHLRSQSPSSPISTSELQAAEAHYMTKALSLQRHALQNLTTVNPEEVLNAALFIFHYIYLTENQFAVRPGPDSKYHIPTRALHLGRATIDLFHTFPGTRPLYYELYCPRTDLILAARPHSSTFIESALRDLDRVENFLETNNSSQPFTYGQIEKRVLEEMLKSEKQMINFLTGNKEEVFPAARNMLALFPLRSEKRFEEMLDEGREVAMGLLARVYAVMYVLG